MKAINYHIKAIIITLEQLFKGKYLIYFIPGVVITLVFWYFKSKVASVGESEVLHSSYNWVNYWVENTFSVIGVIMEQIYIFIVLTVLSPFFTSLGENMDKNLTGHTVKGGILRFINDIIRMVFVVLLMVIMEFLFMGLYSLIAWIFGLSGPHDAFVYLLISSFFFGLSFYDFALERYSKDVFATIGFAFSNPLGMIIVGLIFLGLYNIPFIGIPLSPVLAVMISTVAYAYYTKVLPKVNKKTTLAADE